MSSHFDFSTLRQMHKNATRLFVGGQLRSMRLSRGFSLVDAAKYIGIDNSNLSRIERGKFSPNVDTVAYIAACYGFQLSFERLQLKFKDYDPYWKSGL